MYTYRSVPFTTYPLWLLLAALILLLSIGLYQPVSATVLPRPHEETRQRPAGQSTFLCSNVTTLPLSECEALVNFYLATDGLNWTNRSGWLTAPDPCTWYGVTCAGGRVTTLLLPDNGLAGPLPAAIGSLTGLRVLDLAENPAPATTQATTQAAAVTATGLAAMRQQLATAHAAFTDHYQQQVVAQTVISRTATLAADSPFVNHTDATLRSPAFVETESELRDLLAVGLSATAAERGQNARDQSLAAAQPLVVAEPRQAWLTQLTDLSPTERQQLTAGLDTTGFNQLAGPLPSALQNLTNLIYLDLSGNAFSGTLPTSLGNLTNLTMLDLTGHQFSGTLPAELGNLSRLQRLELAGARDAAGYKLSQLSGPIPLTWGNLSNLLVLDLNYNQLSGPIPSTLGWLSQLQTLTLFWNNLAGGIPPAVGNLTNLSVLDLGANPLGGTIPAELFKLTSLKILGISGNRLSGSISPNFGNLSKLQTLLLSYNQLSGSIPATLGNLRELSWLDLSNSTLSGPIPPELGNATSLRQLHLQQNQLSGPFPAALGQLSGMWELRLDDNQLSGPLPAAIAGLSSLELLWLNNNRLSGSIPPELFALPALHGVLLTNNQLSGPLPPTLGQQPDLTLIGLSVNRLSGPIPSTIGNLANLRQLLLGNNQLSGPIPPALGNLQQLTLLDLGSNQLSGPIPPTLGNLTALTSLTLMINNLSGPIPVELTQLTALQTLHLYSNQLSGPIPAGIGRLTDLTQLILASNYLTGTIPAEVGTLQQLTTLWLYDNRLEGVIPATLGNLQNLTDLWLENNRFSGEIPATLGNLTGLQRLEVSINRLEGTIPDTLGNLVNLQVLGLANNRLSGTIPASLGNLTGLTALWLSKNALQGEIPTTIANLTKLTILSLGANHLQGSIPAALGNLTALHWLFLNSNALSGPIPTTLGNLTALTRLYLGSNQLSGPIPVELANLADLGYLLLGVNQLSGPIPAQLGALRNLHTLKLDFNHLQGPLPPALGNLTYLAVLSLSENSLSGAIPAELTTLPYLQQLWLNHNMLTGAVPPHLGNLARLATLRLDSNLLHGPLPTQLVNLTRLGELGLAYNQLTVADATLATFLEGKTPGWEESQTLPPTDLKANVTAIDTISLAWTPLPYSGNGGFYEVSYATAINGPFTVHGKTVDKAVPGYTVTGLDADTVYYFRVRTYTPPHARQHNALWSADTAVVMATTPTARAAGDQHEADNECSQARTIVADGYTQRHTFHSAGDLDWVHFTARAGMPYRVEVQLPNQSPVDVQVDIFAFCPGGSPLASWRESFSPGARLDFTPTVAGAYFVQLTNTDQAVGDESFAYDLRVRTLNSEARTDAVILVAGKLRDNDPLQSNIHNVLNNAYQLFRDSGYSDSQITYLATDPTVPGYDGAATVANLQNAVTLWAKDQVASDHAITIFLMDHGDPGQFYLDRPKGEILRPADFDQWLTSLETAVPGIQINVIIEACYAGSFVMGNSATLSKAGRVVLTSTTYDSLAFASYSGAYFSDSLLTALREGQHLYGGFEQARRALQSGGGYQQPWLDANGNRQPNEFADAAIAARRTLGTNVGSLPTNWRPYIKSARLDQNAADTSVTIVAEVTDDQAVREVWAIIYPPDYEPPTDSNELQPEDQPTVVLTLQAGLYRGVYSGFSTAGRYRIFIHATDDDQLLAAPVELTTGKPRSLGETSAYQLYLPLVQLRAAAP